MYCPPEYHNSVDKSHDLETLKKAWISLHEKAKDSKLPYKIAFTGGEPTVNKSFLPFVSWIRDNYQNYIGKILVTTNGSANLKYYKKLYKYVDNISFSIHSEHINEKKFFQLLLDLKKTLEKEKFLHVNIMNEFWNHDRIVQYKQILNKNDISYTLNEIDYQRKTREIPIFKGNLNLDRF